MIEMLKKLFGNAEEADRNDTEANTPTEKKTDPPNTDQDGIEEFVNFVVRSLVDEPDSVRIDSEQDDNSTTVIKISCEKQDIGKVIGKKGKTISAIRALANGAGGRIGQRVNVEVLD